MLIKHTSHYGQLNIKKIEGRATKRLLSWSYLKDIHKNLISILIWAYEHGITILTDDIDIEISGGGVCKSYGYTAFSTHARWYPEGWYIYRKPATTGHATIRNEKLAKLLYPNATRKTVDVENTGGIQNEECLKRRMSITSAPLFINNETLKPYVLHLLKHSHNRKDLLCHSS